MSTNIAGQENKSHVRDEFDDFFDPTSTIEQPQESAPGATFGTLEPPAPTSNWPLDAHDTAQAYQASPQLEPPMTTIQHYQAPQDMSGSENGGMQALLASNQRQEEYLARLVELAAEGNKTLATLLLRMERLEDKVGSCGGLPDKKGLLATGIVTSAATATPSQVTLGPSAGGGGQRGQLIMPPGRGTGLALGTAQNAEARREEERRKAEALERARLAEIERKKLEEKRREEEEQQRRREELQQRTQGLMSGLVANVGGGGLFEDDDLTTSQNKRGGGLFED